MRHGSLNDIDARRPAARRRGGRAIRIALLVCAASFLFGFCAMPSLHRLVHERVFGDRRQDTSDADDGAKAAASVSDGSRTVEVRFVGNVDGDLAWKFAPEAASVKVHPGTLTEIEFDASNLADATIVGNAVPSIAPNRAALYFSKTECFCFSEQTLKPGESRRLPVKFVVDPKLPADVAQITLSYTFRNDEIATRRLATQASPQL